MSNRDAIASAIEALETMIKVHGDICHAQAMVDELYCELDETGDDETSAEPVDVERDGDFLLHWSDYA